MAQDAKDKYWLRSGLLNIVQNFSGVFFGFASFYFLVRLLSKHDFGVWTLFMSVATILEIVRSGLIQSALIRFISSSDKAEHSKIISASVVLSASVTLVCILLCMFFGRTLASIWGSSELTRMFYVYSILFFLTGFLTQFHSVEQANLHFTGIVISNFIRQISFFSYVFLCFFADFQTSLSQLIWVQIVGAFVAVIVSYFHARSFLYFEFKIYKDWMFKLFNYGKYAFGTSVSSMLSGTIDQMMLGALLSPAASGAFNIAIRITNLVDIPTNAVATVVFPQSAKRMETDGPEAIRYLYEKSVGTILAILIPCMFSLYFLAGPIVHFIAGEKFDDSIPLLKITLLYCLLIPYGRQFGTIMDSIGKTKLNFLIVISTAILNLALNYIFILKFGVLGAAYATLISNCIGFTIAQSILKKQLQVNILHTFIYAYRFYPEMFNRYVFKNKNQKANS